MRDEVGKWIPAGIAVGIRKNSGSIGKAMDELAKETTGGLQTEVLMGVRKSQSVFGSSKMAQSGGRTTGAGTHRISTTTVRRRSARQRLPARRGTLQEIWYWHWEYSHEAKNNMHK